MEAFMKTLLLIIALIVGVLPSSIVVAADKVVVIPLGGDEHYMYWQGEWAAATTYKIGDAVQYDGSSYISTQAHTSTLSNVPPSASWDLLAAKGADQKGSVFRWQVFSSYSNDHSWVMSNSAALHGGVSPSNWTDNSGVASDMSNDAEVLRTLLTRKGYGGANAMVHSEIYNQYSSTNGRVIVALFRVKNTTGSDIGWTPYFYHTCTSTWGERASIAMNGSSIWSSGTTNCTASTQSHATLSVPPNQVSTIIVVSTSSLGKSLGSGMYVRNVNLTFYNDSLTLPAGLEYVDDLDSAVGMLW